MSEQNIPHDKENEIFKEFNKIIKISKSHLVKLFDYYCCVMLNTFFTKSRTFVLIFYFFLTPIIHMGHGGTPSHTPSFIKIYKFRIVKI